MPVTPLELELWDLSDTEVRVEWSNMDILVLNHSHQMAVVIENKIGSAEHSDQLNRYYSLLAQEYPGWRILPLFLSPKGEKPTDSRYIPVTYELIAALIEQTIAKKGQGLSSSVLIILQHYLELLRRHVVTDSKVKELCREIYRKHGKAIDLIVSYQKDRLLGIRETRFEKPRNDQRLEVGGDNANAFIPVAWKQWISKTDDRSWAKDGAMILFWFEISEQGVRLILEIGPGDRQIAQKLLDAAQANKPPLDPQSKAVGRKWNRIARMRMVSASAMQSEDHEKIETEFDANWERFIEQDMDAMEEPLRKAVST